MPEKIVSPGVFTEEKDLSFLPAGIANIGAAFIGPTIKGPAFVPTPVSSFGEFTQIFGNTSPNLYLPYTVKEYLNTPGTATIVRVLHDDGYEAKDVIAIVATGSFGKKHIGLIHPTQAVTATTNTFTIGASTSMFQVSSLSSNSSGSFVLTLSGSGANPATSYSASLIQTNANYLPKVFSKIASSTTNKGYLYTFFPEAASASLAADPATYIVLETSDYTSESTYSEAITPWIISQTVNNTNTDLFRFHTHADGTTSNYELKIAINNIRPAGTVAGSEYGSFTVTVRAIDQTYLKLQGSPYDTQDTDIKPNIIESFPNCNLDPNSPRYIARVIGDQYKEFTGGKVVVRGNYSNKSKYIFVEMDSAVDNGIISDQLVPFGFKALYNPVPSAFTNVPAASFVTSQVQASSGLYKKQIHFGFDFDFSNSASPDNINYLKPLPANADLTNGSNTNFLLSNYNQAAGANFPTATTAYSGAIDLSTNTSIESRKFVVPFQGGFDGTYPNRNVATGTSIDGANTQGYDLSGISAKDYSVYTNAIDTVSNPDELDINVLVMPGVIYEYHPAVINYAADMCQDRSDTFLVFDCVGLGADIDDAVDTINTFDNNYAATYYPWVKLLDTGINKPVWVPPTVVIPGVLASNDRVAAEWYAPAGLNRGGLTNVIDVYTRLTHAERDDLYEGRVNPIATFPGAGICVWGQKTLQVKPSALDRINVRRLLIAVKKFIASATKYLVFEQNTAATRNRFLNIVNPYLESVQQRQGLYGFRVVMDETNNTADLIDRNIMYGQIYLQPTKTAEFIIIDFNILPTGATFGQ